MTERSVSGRSKMDGMRVDGDSDSLDAALAAIVPVADAALEERVRSRLDHLTKPIGALGRLERLAIEIALIQRSDQPRLRCPALLVFAADHGVAAAGVSAYPRDVTAQMVANIAGGGAAVNVLCRQHDIALTVIDVGVIAGKASATDPGDPTDPRSRSDRSDPTDPAPTGAAPADGAAPNRVSLVRRPVAAGTADLIGSAAMTADQCRRALAIGRAQVASTDADAILLGEMGIGNTSSAALLTAWATGTALAACVGRGTGLDDAGLARKQALLARAWSRHASITDPMQALAALGGLEIAALVGAIIEAARRRRVVVIDGFVVTAALLIAARLAPAVVDYCVLAHRSGEAGHGAALAWLGRAPLLDLAMRLGEGSGAALAWPLIASSLDLLEQMATFESAGVSNREDRSGEDRSGEDRSGEDWSRENRSRENRSRENRAHEDRR